ncbi:MAG: hypothetical protein Q7R80_00820 [bacterium]|nr:hypothetical protein [bacterium]
MWHFSQRRRGFVDPGTIAMIALLAVGAISLATTSRALDEAVSTDTATNTATEMTATEPPPLPPVEPTPVVPAPTVVDVPVNAPPVNAPTPAPTNAAPVPVGTVQPTPADHLPSDIEATPDEKPNPQECRDVRKQIRDQFRELNRFEKLLRKLGLTADLERLIALRAKLKQYDAGIASGCTRDRLQEFWDEQVWEEINTFRCKAELPQQFVQMERDFKRLVRQAAPKRLAVTGLNAAAFNAHVEKSKQALAEAKAAVASGSCEDANEAMQTFWEEGLSPGDMMGIVNRLYDLGSQLKRVKDVNVRAEFQEVLQPIIDAANEGDFRDANQAMNDVYNELQQLLYKVIASRRYKYAPRLDKLEALLDGKFGKEETMPAVPVE